MNFKKLQVINISGIIFLDLDGTLLDTSMRHYKLYRDILDKKGFTTLPLKKFWQMKRTGKKTGDILPEYLSKEFLASFEKEWIEKIEKKSYLQYDELFPGIKEMLSHLNNEFDLVLVTLRNNTENLHWEIFNLGLNGYFKSIISGEGPKKKLIKNYLINNHNGEACLIVGDTEEDIKTGVELDIPTICVTCGIRSKEFLESFDPDFCINDLSSIVEIIDI